MDLYVFCFFLLFSGLWIFSSKRKHFLSTLLSLEYMVLGVYLIFLLSLGLTFYFYSLVYLIFTACEGALGLSILVVMGRTHGSDYFISFNSMMS